MSGFKRSSYQVLPSSLAKINCVNINDHSFASSDWFVQSVEIWDCPEDLLERRAASGTLLRKGWDFVLVTPLISVQSYWAGNDGMQAWRHRKTGYTIPDHCRQTGGCPEVWSMWDVKGKKERIIQNLHQIEPYVILDHNQVLRSAFPEHSLQNANQISYR